MSLNTSNKLEEIYDALDSGVYTSFYKLNSELKYKLRDIVNELENSEEIRNAALLEYYVTQFQLAVDGLNDFDLQSLPFHAMDKNYTEYFENRINQASNPFILARYNHILWIAKKHNKFATEAIKNYLVAKDIVIKQKNSNKYWTFDLLECLKRSFLIKRKIKNEADSFNIEQEIISTISMSLESECGFIISFRLLDTIILSHKYFKDVLTYDFLNSINQYAQKLIINNESFQAIRILELTIKITEKMNYDATDMYINLGTANEIRMNDFNKSIGGISYCLEAIKIYSKLKMNSKVDELKKTYEEISSNMKFGTVKTEIDIEPIIAETNHHIAWLQKLPTDNVIQSLVYDKMFIPSKDFIVSCATKPDEGFLTSLLGGNYNIFDKRGNLVRSYSTDEEKNWYRIMRTYNWMMQFQMMSLNLTLKELISTEKITFEVIYNEMINNTWLSYIFKSSYNGEEFKYTYSNILQALLKEYFLIFNKYLSQKNLPCTEFMMFIDSATLRIEGLIRELFTQKNYPTIIQDNATETVREKDLKALLYDENIKDFFDEDELLFFRYLFVDQDGLNLRNQVAHSLLYEQEYNLGFANLIFLALLRFFKFFMDIK
jgi:hypothetical protein